MPMSPSSLKKTKGISDTVKILLRKKSWWQKLKEFFFGKKVTVLEKIVRTRETLTPIDNMAQKLAKIIKDEIEQEEKNSLEKNNQKQGNFSRKRTKNESN